MKKEYIVYESDLPWWMFFLHPTDAMIMSHYGSLNFAGPPPVYYWKYINHRYPELKLNIYKYNYEK